ncbi:DUF1134 domain-containing protein [Sphingomonas prati]|uniref:DUF1134 domain-containing protein n=1 Tax=Sphingomonas prati TaxID=1843237 RepID=A0A7W9BQT1_9SPHN|nr:DUF1134 domain-containing protein [Sphingomonas prati]MBB5728305.1 hypothetical protein [Sphingomonas prati]
MTMLAKMMRAAMVGLAVLPVALPTAGIAAQIRTVDPSAPSVAGSRGTPRTTAPAPRAEVADYGSETVPTSDSAQVEDTVPLRTTTTSGDTSGSGRPQGPVDAAIAGEASKTDPTSVYQDDDILGAAEGVFGRGAEGLAKAIESVLRKQGRPNAYIAGREVGGAFVVGLRYGSGTMHHKIEGDRPVYWTGPSLGIDFGGSGAKTFVLVYNLYDSQELYKRFPAVEGQAYLVGGFNISYLRRGDVVLIPIRLGVGWRLGANVGYMKFSEKAKVLPF